MPISLTTASLDVTTLTTYHLDLLCELWACILKMSARFNMATGSSTLIFKKWKVREKRGAVLNSQLPLGNLPLAVFSKHTYLFFMG